MWIKLERDKAGLFRSEYIRSVNYSLLSESDSAAEQQPLVFINSKAKSRVLKLFQLSSLCLTVPE